MLFFYWNKLHSAKSYDMAAIAWSMISHGMFGMKHAEKFYWSCHDDGKVAMFSGSWIGWLPLLRLVRLNYRPSVTLVALVLSCFVLSSNFRRKRFTVYVVLECPHLPSQSVSIVPFWGSYPGKQPSHLTFPSIWRHLVPRQLKHSSFAPE